MDSNTNDGIAKRNERTLGCMEEIMHQSRLAYPESALVCKYAPVEGPLTEEIARSALFWLQKRFPLLQASIPVDFNDDHSRHDFSFYDALQDDSAKREAIPLVYSVADTNEVDWKAVLKEEMECTNLGKYLWRCRIASNQDKTHHHVVFNVHHIICDARSLINLMATFLEYCSDIEQKKEKPTNFKEGLLYKSGGDLIQAVTEQAGDQQKPEQKQEEKKTEEKKNEMFNFGYDKFVPLADRKGTGYFYQEISPEIFLKIKDASKKKGLSVNSFLGSALLHATVKENKVYKDKHKDGEEAPDYDTMMYSAVDIRKYCKPDPENELHFITMAVPTTQTVKGKSDLWGTAQQYQDQVKTAIENSAKTGWYPKGLTKPACTGAARMLESFDKDAQMKWAAGVLTNIGNIGINDEYGKFKLTNLLYVVSNATGHLGQSITVSTFKNKMNVNVLYTECMLEKETIERTMKQFMKNVEEMIKE